MPLPAAVEEAAPSRPTVWQRVRVVLLAFAIFLCLLTVSSGLGLYGGYRRGEADRSATAVAAADEHYRLGLTRLDAGEFELAIAEFEYALELQPDHPLASQGLAEAQARLAARPTPTSQAAEDIARNLYVDGMAAYDRQDWEEAARLLGQLRVFDPGYESQAVRDMLFTSLYNHGMAMLAEDHFEEGIFYLDQASQIRALDSEALLELELAHRYMTALGYWGVDWDLCIRRFEDLYAVAPGYKDVFSRLYQAHVIFGDLWVEQEEMCPAATQYARALELANDPDLEQRESAAAEICAVATPTPIPPITGTLPATGTVTVAGFRIGRLAYPAPNSLTGQYDIYAVVGTGTDGQLTRVAAGADQPSWQWGSSRLVFRNRLAASISLVQPGTQPTTLQSNSGAAWPTLSPDGNRYAYAARDSAGVWHVYIARTGSISEPVVHAPGWGPAWGPSGLLAWTGCQADGSGCGIFVDNPDDAQPPVRLTANRNDGGIHWHPNGDSLLYMSDHSGSWDIYTLYTNGAVDVVTDEPTHEGLPAWAPDASAIAFLSYREERWGIYLMDPSGDGVRKIIDLGTDLPNWQDQRLSWAP
jgi:tetratricopeptide (TPR) repeat protein